ncbi:MAG: carboxypeptidase regulatory-like domain-containing protein [Alphaproteobacteria bacterium]|nr:carboxypeptidase regulatory-like domain-containing protein [Alphaproteobacteria bacterium]
MPASAAEDAVTMAAKTGTISGVSEPSDIALSPAALLEARPTSVAQTAADALAADVSVSSNTSNTADLGAFAPSNETYELILGVRRKRDFLSNALLGLQKGFDYYIPAYELARLLRFPSQFDPQSGVLNGYFIAPANSYTINAREGTYTVAGETARLPEGSIIVGQSALGHEDIFLTPEALNLIWNLELELDFSQLTLKINTPRKLPYEQDKLRKERQEQLENQDGAAPDLDLIYVPSGYRMLGPQTLKLTESAQYVDSEFTNIFNIAGDGDFLGTTADYNLTLQSDSRDKLNPENARLRLTREDDGSGRTLPLGLRIAQVGDVSARTSPLISTLLSGRGAYISSDRQSRQRQAFDLVTIEGSGQPGWEVEIYRQKELIDYSYVDETGLYRFVDVPLNYGKNTFRIVLYGPNGQIEEKTEEYFIKNDNLRPGQTTFEAGVFQENTPLIDVRDDNNSNSNNGWSQFLKVNHGINQWINGFATYTQTTGKDEDKQYVSVGANVNAFGGYGLVEAYKDIDGGQAIDGRFVKKFAGINTNTRISLYNDFESRDTGFGGAAKTFEADFRATKSFATSLGLAGLTFDAEHTKRENGRSNTRLNSVQSLALDNTNITNSVVSSYQNSDLRVTNGQLAVNNQLSPNWGVRSLLQYDLYPDAEPDEYRFNLRYSDLDKFRSSLTVNQGIKDTDKTSATLNASYDFGNFLGGADLGWTRGDGFDVYLRANTTLGPDGEDREYIATTKYTGYTTALKAQLYKDLNKDGQFNAGDIPVKNARIYIDKRKSDPSDKDGMINVIGAGPPGTVAITLDRRSLLEDPFLVPEKDGYEAILRPGTKPFINFPLYPSGSIDGTLRRADGTGANGYVIQLLDQNGNLVQEVPTLFDGFYVFEFVREGTYIVQVSPSHQVNVPPKTVTVTSEDLFAYGVDLILLEQAAEVSVTDDSVVRDGGRVAQLNHAPVADGTLQPAPFSSDGPFDTVVNSVRIGEHPYKTRLVLDLSEPTTYRISSEDGGRIVNIDLPKTAWDATREWKLSKHPMLEECGVYSIDNGTGTRLRLTGRKPVTIFYNASIPKENGLPDRVYIDFLKK